MTTVPATPNTVRALFAQRDYPYFWFARLVANIGVMIQSVALGWQVYNIARQTHTVAESSLYVGLIGLVSFLPLLFFVLIAGETADRYERKRILLICLAIEIVCAAALTYASWRGEVSIALLLVIAFVFGCGRAFFAPANTALGPMLVPRELLPCAIAWNSRLAIRGNRRPRPWRHSRRLVADRGLWDDGGALCRRALSLALIRQATTPAQKDGSRWQLMKEGLAYTWNNKIVFGAISLDLFAVLLGGVTALLPAFARDVLFVGEREFGILRAAPAIGAAAVALVLASRPIRARAGQFMFGGVAVYGLATIVFGLSKLFWLSLGMLIVLGAADMLSVFVRQTLVQLVTPDPMRGRVAAVSYLFIGASNELGEFESGVVARLLGPVGAALFGGIGALMVTGFWWRLFPALRRADRLE
ncbi:MAG: MFS transporter [Alphaproteobacteria bacterium]